MVSSREPENCRFDPPRPPRPDLADIRLKGRVEAANFVAGRAARIAAPLVDMRRAPKADAGLDTQLLRGAGILVFDVADGWAWVQADHDGCEQGSPDQMPVPRHISPEPGRR